MSFPDCCPTIQSMPNSFTTSGITDLVVLDTSHLSAVNSPWPDAQTLSPTPVTNLRPLEGFLAHQLRPFEPPNHSHSPSESAASTVIGPSPSPAAPFHYVFLPSTPNPPPSHPRQLNLIPPSSQPLPFPSMLPKPAEANTQPPAQSWAP